MDGSSSGERIKEVNIKKKGRRKQIEERGGEIFSEQGKKENRGGKIKGKSREACFNRKYG